MVYLGINLRCVNRIISQELIHVPRQGGEKGASKRGPLRLFRHQSGKEGKWAKWACFKNPLLRCAVFCAVAPPPPPWSFAPAPYIYTLLHFFFLVHFSPLVLGIGSGSGTDEGGCDFSTPLTPLGLVHFACTPEKR
jgi:hypothetical protein